MLVYGLFASVCFLYVLDMFWTCFEYVLSAVVCVGMCLICVEYVLGMCWRVVCLRWYLLVCV